MKISMIAAMAENGAIGHQGGMPWGHAMKGDLKRFRELTLNHTVIMGRKTFESLDSWPLPGRDNIVLSRRKIGMHDGALWLDDLDLALRVARERGETECFIIGGARVFQQALERARRLYLTVIHTFPEGDTLMPLPRDRRRWVVGPPEAHEKDADNPYDYTFFTLSRLY